MDETTTVVEQEAQEQEQPNEQMLESLPMLPLRETVAYPLTVMPLAVGQERSLRMIESVLSTTRIVGMVAVKDRAVEVAEPEDCFTIGCTARVQQVLRVPDGTIRLLIQGLERIRILEWQQREPFITAHCEPIPEYEEDAEELDPLVRNVQGLFQRYVGLSPALPDEMVTAAINIELPKHLAYFIATNIRLEVDERQEILSIDSLKAKFEWLTGVLTREVEVLEISKRIQSEAQERMSSAQKEYYLREQLRAIRKELGEVDEEQAEIAEIRKKIEDTELSAEARKEADRELARLEKLPAASPEHSVIRTYLDWLTSLPWGVSGGGMIDVAQARKILDEDHYDLEKVKARILEYLAVRQLKEKRRNVQADESSEEITRDDTLDREPILCFVGPPGVGKTSLGQSIARAMGRKFVRMSLGGVRDEAEIRGHRRTYVGAMPGRFIQAIRRAETNDPVFMLDEVDKIGADWRGDPSSALLETLDPEQNKDFRDHYLDVSFDLSKVMFITTANTLDTVPPALRDRMEIIQLPGYTEEEKLHIANRYLVPKQRKAHGLDDEEAVVNDDGIRTVIRDYTREAGVRNLEREIANIFRKTATNIAEGKTEITPVGPDQVREHLGKPQHFSQAAERIDRPGIATGLVWTPTGGDIIFVEAATMPGRKTLQLTGQIGDVMKESAEAALSYVRSQAERFGINPRFFDRKDIHIHVPAGAVPKDGPSAGITLTVALVSLLTERLVRSDLAMTGEITLRGKVMPVGGVKEKMLGAHRAGISTIILPKRNENDLDDLTKELREELNFVLVENADEVVEAALEAAPARMDEASEPVGVA